MRVPIQKSRGAPGVKKVGDGAVRKRAREDEKEEKAEQCSAPMARRM
jgi:hypothetical protein